ncbi:MAG: branched-chain amino acid ABC transporter permease, partial [Halomonas sp.]|nr:branched-chain amino acid ABC transporter permease [Halomonas sp.]
MRPRFTHWMLAGTVAAMLALPAVLSPAWLGVASNMLIAALFALAYNLLIGQGGLLSFGHAAYFGIGSFATIHAMVAVERGGLWLPTPLLPLAGGVAGLLIGAGAGYFACKRSGVYFAMVTLAIAELLHALAPNLSSVFGGETGIFSMRQPWLGVDFGSSHH